MRTITLLILSLAVASGGCSSRDPVPDHQQAVARSSSGNGWDGFATSTHETASQQDLSSSRPQDRRRGTNAVRGAVGFTLDPDTFLLSAAGEHFVNDNVAVGPLLQLGVSDDWTILAPTVNVRGVFDVVGHGLENLKPFAQGGLGMAYLNKDRHGDDDDVGFLLNFGFGADYYLNDRISVGNNVMFNFLPDKLVGETFFFSWQFVSASFRF